MVPILTYHSQNIRGNTPRDNDHVALCADLEVLHAAGKRVIPLDRLVDWLDGEAPDTAVENAVVLTFDDGCDFDVRDLDHPDYGVQRSFIGIMRDFLNALPEYDRPELHATTFVIASRSAREKIDAGSLFAKGWISDDWWHKADADPLLCVENHGWDHNHPDIGDRPGGNARGNFHTVDTRERCMEQVVQAAEAIAEITGRRPRYFAYPFGESSEYIRREFFPGYTDEHGCRAALGTEPGRVTRKTGRWNLPRYVCGRDWTTPQELLKLLNSGAVQATPDGR